jgi:aminopeptidase N
MKTITRSLVSTSCSLLLMPPAWGATSFSFDAAPGRLPKNVVPVDYTIDITPDVKNLTLTGSESVTLLFRSATASVIFNSLNETLHAVRLDGKSVKSVVSDDAQQLTTVTLARVVPVGRHTLTFAYAGKIESQPRGLFSQAYVESGGAKGFLLSTKMESTDARRMFPCWDEPAFRATFQLSATVPAAWATVSNMPIAKRVEHGELATIAFGRSPKMPSYLIEFTAGQLAQISAESSETRFGVWAVRGQEHGGETALANAQQILADYNEYFGYRYPLPKLDSIAIPGGFTGAMENWGAITYNDQILLLTASSTIANRQTVFSVQAHEMAHQWNGDLVTMGWWDDLWLNESFASWMAAKETSMRNPSWRWWEGEDEVKEGAMSADARAASHAIQQHVTDELQAASAFDPDITYSKGQAILRMLEAYVGPEVFRSAIRSYIKAHAFSNASTGDLWQALNLASGQDVGIVAADWTERAGFPLVDVVASCDSGGARTVRMSQQRFLLRGADPAHSHWSIPLQIRAGSGNDARTVLLTQDGQTAPAGRCDEPLSLNADAIGFYRTKYDPATLAINTQNFASLSDAERIAMLDDQWALVESGAAQLPSFLALASAMGTDLDPRAWEQIATALAEIEYDEQVTPGHEVFAAYARSVIKPAFERLGWNSKPSDTPDIQRLRRTLTGDLGAWGDQEIISEARRRFIAFVADHNAIGPDDQELILSIVAQHADAATFDSLHAVAKAAKDESELRRYYAALMDVRDPNLAAQAAQIALSGEIPPQADSLRLRLIRRLATEHQALAWAVLGKNYDALMAAYPKYAPLITAQYIPQGFWSGVPLSEVESWVRAHVPPEMSPNVDRGMETAHFKLAEKRTLVPAADAYVH